MCDYLKHNPVDGFIFGGDQLDMAEVSHWNHAKPLYRKQGALAANLEGFRRGILDPLDKLLGKKSERIWITSNHERFLTLDLIEEHPELDGMLGLDEALALRKRGHKIIGQGGHYQLGNL